MSSAVPPSSSASSVASLSRTWRAAPDARPRSWRTADRKARKASSSAPAAVKVTDPIRIVPFVASRSARAGRSGASSWRGIP